jgi:hypothetical protein
MAYADFHHPILPDGKTTKGEERLNDQLNGWADPIDGFIPRQGFPRNCQ